MGLRGPGGWIVLVPFLSLSCLCRLGMPDVDDEIEALHAAYNDEDYEALWALAHPEIPTPQAEFRAALEATRERLGEITRSRVLSQHVEVGGGRTGGVVVVSENEYERGVGRTTMRWVFVSGEPRLLGYRLIEPAGNQQQPPAGESSSGDSGE